jgi:hypothetical protein
MNSIQYDEKSGKLSFTTRLSVGVVRSATANEWNLRDGSNNSGERELLRSLSSRNSVQACLFFGDVDSGLFRRSYLSCLFVPLGANDEKSSSW